MPPPDGDQTDTSGRTGADPRRPDTGRVDTGRPDARSRTTSPGDWTPGAPDSGRAGQPGPGRRNRMGGHPCWTRTGDRRHGWRSGMSSTATVPAGWMAAGRSAGQRRLGDQPTRTAQQQGLRGGSRSYGRGLTTATTGSCSVRFAGQAAPRRTAVLRRLRVEGRAAWRLASGIRQRMEGLSGADRYSAIAGCVTVAERALVELVSPLPELLVVVLAGARRKKDRARLRVCMRALPWWPRSIPVPRCGPA
jgi:hypothetical protein